MLFGNLSGFSFFFFLSLQPPPLRNWIITRARACSRVNIDARARYSNSGLSFHFGTFEAKKPESGAFLLGLFQSVVSAFDFLFLFLGLSSVLITSA